MIDNNSREHWDKIWAHEKEDTWRIYPKTFATVCRIVGRDRRILELGCGVGILANQMAKNHNNVLGIDISEKAIHIMEHAFSIPGMVAKLPPIPTDIYFDFVVATEFLEHFEDPTEILKEMSRVADCAIIVVPDNVLGNDECSEHYQKFTLNSLKDLLNKYWRDVSILSFIEKFDTGKVHIELPTLIALCRGKK